MAGHLPPSNLWPSLDDTERKGGGPANTDPTTLELGFPIQTPPTVRDGFGAARLAQRRPHPSAKCHADSCHLWAALNGRGITPDGRVVIGDAGAIEEDLSALPIDESASK